MQDPEFTFAELYEFLLHPPLQPVQVPLIDLSLKAQTSGVSAIPLSFVIGKLAEENSVPSSRSLNKLNKIGPSTDPWGTLPTTGLHLDCATAIQPGLNPLYSLPI